MSTKKIDWEALKIYTARYIIVPRSIQTIRQWCKDNGHAQEEMALHVERTLKAIGKHAMEACIGPTLQPRDIHRASPWSAPTTRAHLDVLVRCGEMRREADGRLSLRHMHGRIPSGRVIKMPSSHAFWSARRAYQAAIRRAGRSKRAGKEFSFLPAEISAIPELYGALNPLCFSNRAHAHTNDSAALAGDVADQGKVVDPPSGLQPAAPSFVRINAPEKTSVPPCPIKPDEIEAVEDDLLADAGRVAEAKGLELLPPSLRARAVQAAERESAPPSMPQPVAPPAAEKSPPAPRVASRPRKTCPADILTMAQQRGLDDGLNVLAVANTGASRDVIMQAMGVLADATSARQRKHGAVRNPPAFLVGIVRRLMLQPNRKPGLVSSA